MGSLNGGKLAGGNPDRGRVDNDFYATDPKSTRALLDAVKFEGNDFLEPCCGQGHIAKVIEEYYPNANITAFDIVDRGYGTGNIDFLTYETDKRFDNVITNPPFALAQEFIEKSYDLLKENGKIAMFLKLSFLESTKREEFFKKMPLKYVYVFRSRSSPWRNGSPVDENGKKWSSTICFAWFIFEKGYTGEPIVRWL